MSREMIDLMFYQYLHDKNYHHDIYVLNRKGKLNHLIHHLHKYNNAGIKSPTWLVDTLACLLSMAGAMNMHLDKELECILNHPVRRITDISPLYNEDCAFRQLDENLRVLSKTMESLDHIEDFDFNGALRTSITTLVILVFQLSKICDKLNTVEFVKRYFERLEAIKVKHCFHEYFDESLQSCETYVRLRQVFLPTT